MKILVTTTNSIKLIDTISKDQKMVFGGRSGLWGMTWYKDNLYVTAESIHNHIGLNVFDKNLELIDIIPFNILVHPHQISEHDGLIWITNTGRNTIVSYDISSRQVDEYNLPDTGGNFNDPIAKDHFNSILFKDDKMYVCAHNGENPSVILEMDENLNEMSRITLGGKTHNISLKDQIMVCCSKTKTIRTLDKIIYSGNHFLRGLIHTDDEIIFGMSWVGKREERRKTNSGASIGILKGGDLEIIPIDNSGQIYDIRILDKFDYAHGVKPFL